MSACSSAYVKESLDEQIRLYTLCLTQGEMGRSNLAGAFINRGVAYVGKGDLERALADFTKSIQYDPRYGLAYMLRGYIYQGRGQLDLAETDFSTSLQYRQVSPRDLTYAYRGLIRMARGNCAAAEHDFNEAQERNRKIAWRYAAKAWILATCADAQYRKGAEAMQFAQTAISMEDHWKFHDVLAAAYAESGRFEDSVREMKVAQALIDANEPGSPWRTGLSARLALYETGKPFREAPSDAIAAEWQMPANGGRFVTSAPSSN